MHNFWKRNIETSEMSKDNIKELLLTRNADPLAVDDFIALTELWSCEICAFIKCDYSKDYDKAVSIISDLEKQI
jgi:hypothetical protein